MLKKDNQAPRKKATIISYAKKKEMIEAIENGQISMNQAAKLHNVSRSSIQRWFQKLGNFEKKLLKMGGKSAQQEIKELRARLKEYEAKEVIWEMSMDVVEKEFGISKKKLLPEPFQRFLKDTKRK